jgi:phage terminase Nu1 subunit (DNA packaging protein)
MPPLLSHRAYAAHRAAKGLPGTTHRAVQKAIEKGRITLVNGKIDPALADVQWAENTNEDMRRSLAQEENARKRRGYPSQAPAAAAPAADQGRTTLAQVQTLEKGYKAKLAQLEYEKQTGKLVNAEEISARWVDIATTLRNRVLGIASKVKQRIPHLSHADVLAIDTIARETLQGIADDLGPAAN